MRRSLPNANVVVFSLTTGLRSERQERVFGGCTGANWLLFVVVYLLKQLGSLIHPSTLRPARRCSRLVRLSPLYRSLPQLTDVVAHPQDLDSVRADTLRTGVF